MWYIPEMQYYYTFKKEGNPVIFRMAGSGGIMQNEIS